jgi:lysophospholipase L1-like esterase
MKLQIKLFLQIAACCLFLLFVIEVLARLVSTVSFDVADLSAPHKRWFRSSPIVGWEAIPGFKGKVNNDYREFNDRGFLEDDHEETSERAPKTVLFIGDSNTFGLGVPTPSSFAEVTEQLLPGTHTVNLGINGYTSYQGRKVLEKYLSQNRPAAVVASFNFNDRRAVKLGEEDSPAHFQKNYNSTQSVIRRINEVLLSRLYFYRSMAVIMRRVGLLPLNRVHEPIDKLLPRVDKKHYRENLISIVEQTNRAGIPLIFILLRDNPLETGYLKNGIEKLEKGEYQVAAEYFNVLVRANSWHADLGRIYLSRAYRAMGKEGEAAEAVRAGKRMVSSQHGGRPIRLAREYNSIMREVANQYNISLVDGASVLETDPYVFIDFCHFASTGHRKVAELLAPELAKKIKLVR